MVSRACASFREQDWDLVITDLMMPTMSGEEMASVIRAEAPGGPDHLDDRLGGFHPERPGNYAMIAKRFIGGELIALVARVLAAAGT